MIPACFRWPPLFSLWSRRLLDFCPPTKHRDWIRWRCFVKSKMKTLVVILVACATTLQGQPKTAAETLARVSRVGDLKTAETFISAGIDPNLADRYGRTPLYYAALFNRNEIAALLLAHDAD